MFCALALTLKGRNALPAARPDSPEAVCILYRGGAYDPSDGLWKPNKDGLGLGHVFDEINKVYGEDFLRYKPLDNEED